MNDIYDPEFVADLFDKCSGNYRICSAISSFGFVRRRRRQCIAALPDAMSEASIVVDLMAGTGEIWPHLLRRFPQVGRIVAIDISPRMHTEAVARLHGPRAHRISHIEANALEHDLPLDYADALISSFGLKTFNRDQQEALARRVAQTLKPGGAFSLIEASDPKAWALRPLYRAYIDRVLPLIERFFLRGAQDFSMIGAYTRNFGDIGHFAQCLRDQGLQVTERSYFFGCASGVFGHKPPA